PNPKAFFFAEAGYLDYRRTKARIRASGVPHRVLVYEDLLSQGMTAARILDAAGLPNTSDVAPPKTCKQNIIDDKLRLFRNPERVVELYRSTMLEQAFPAKNF